MSELVKKIEEHLSDMIELTLGTKENFSIKSIYADKGGEMLTVIFSILGMPKDFVWHFNVGSLKDETVGEE